MYNFADVVDFVEQHGGALGGEARDDLFRLVTKEVDARLDAMCPVLDRASKATPTAPVGVGGDAIENDTEGLCRELDMALEMHHRHDLLGRAADAIRELRGNLKESRNHYFRLADAVCARSTSSTDAARQAIETRQRAEQAEAQRDALVEALREINETPLETGITIAGARAIARAALDKVVDDE